jgi:hypothetical protein
LIPGLCLLGSDDGRLGVHTTRELPRAFFDFLKNRSNRPYKAKNNRRRKFEIEPVESRLLLSADVSVSAAGILTVMGDKNDYTIVVSRTDIGTILVNGSTVNGPNGIATVINTSLIRVVGGSCNDSISMD